MRVWRLCREPCVSLDGKGAELKGGRWNSPGLPVVYTSAHLSLAVLEVLVHLEVDFEDLPEDYVSVEIDVPGKIRPAVFNNNIDIHNTLETRNYGDRWLMSAQSAALDVPSAVVPKERNVCLSPKHAEFVTIQTVSTEPFSFDQRLFEFG